MRNTLCRIMLASFAVAVASRAPAQCVDCTPVFQDGFEQYAAGAFPGSGGWLLVYSGAGTSSQYVTSSVAASGAQSLHLQGAAGCWAAHAFHPTPTLPSRVVVDADVMVPATAPCGCTKNLATVELFNPSTGTWGTAFGRVSFQCDGNVYAVPNYYDPSRDIRLAPWVANRWHHVTILVDFGAAPTPTFDVFIDGVARGRHVPVENAGAPTGVAVTSGHSPGGTHAYFDDVTVSFPTCSP